MNTDAVEILLVDDDTLVGELTMLFLRKHYQVEFENHPEIALDRAFQRKYRLILMDVNLGHGISGEELVRKIKKDSINSETPVVALTGYSEKPEIDSMYNAGFDQILVKPFSKEQLLELIEKMLPGS